MSWIPGTWRSLESQCRFVGSVAALELLLDAVPVVVVALIIAAAYDPVGVGDQQGSECCIAVHYVAAPGLNTPAAALAELPGETE